MSFGEDQAEVLINKNSLDELFNLKSPSNTTIETNDTNTNLQLVEEMRSQLPALTSGDDPDNILYKNIERANKLLDRIEQEIFSGSFNARLIEVCGQLINAVTAATASIAGNSFAAQKHDYNMEMVKVKQQEVEVKRIVATSKIESIKGGESGSDKKVLVMDRESLLRMIDDEKKDVHVETYKPEEYNPTHRND